MTLYDIIFHFYSDKIFNWSYGAIDDFNDYFSMTNSEGVYLTLDVYLSCICSIITLVVILLFCVFIIKKIIAIIFRLFTGGSAF